MRSSAALAVLLACGLSLVALDACSQAAKSNPAAAEKQKPATQQKKSKRKRQEPRAPRETSQELLSRVLRDFKQGLEGLSPSRVGKEINKELFYDYPRFEENLTVFLRSLAELRLFVREVNVQLEEDRAVMIVDAEMRFTRRQNPDDKQQRKQQITFDFRRTPAGWKITEINPRGFFLP